MSKTNKIRRLESQLCKTEIERDELLRQNVALKAQVYESQKEKIALLKDLEVLKLTFDTSTLLQNQAH